MSTSAPAVQLAVNISSKPSTERDKEVIALLMPLFYTKAPMTPTELSEANRIWQIIVRNQSKHFAALKAANASLAPKLASEYLHLVFYNRLFEVHPGCRGLFSRALNKMNLLPMISLMLSKLGEPESLHKTLLNLVNVHNKIGIKAVEYGIVGEVSPLPCWLCPYVLLLLEVLSLVLPAMAWSSTSPPPSATSPTLPPL